MDPSQPSNDPRVLELTRARLRLREDLQFAADQFGPRPCYIIEDPITSHYFRVGVDEYFFISLLDGQMTVGQAIAATAKARGRDAFTERDAATICRWLLDSGLASTEATVQPRRLLAAARESARQQIPARLNPLLVKVPLGNPDRALQRMLPRLSWLLGWPAFAVWAAVLITAVYHLASQSDRLRAASVGILAPGNWVALGLCWGLLKVVHELAHGLTCKKFGGAILECGIVFILLAPVAYVDATGAWRLQSKWQRIYTSAAGMYAELFCAAVAALVWSYCPPGLASHLAYNIVVMAGVSTLVVNGNPLMRFDAYYMLADFLEIPNLSVRGQQYLLYLGRKYLLGVPADQPNEPPSMVVRLYGIAALLWRTVVLVGLLIAAHAIFFGAGLVVALFAAALWFGIPAARLAKYLAVGNSWEKPQILPLLARTGTAIGITAVVMILPWPGVVRAPAVVRPAPRSIVRSEVAGFVEAIPVRNNQLVRAGQALARITNRQLESDLKDLQLEILETKLLRDQLWQQQELAAAQIQTQYLAALHKRLDEKQREADQLTVRAPISGQLTRRDLPSMQGTYVEPGARLFTIDGPGIELVLSVREDDFQLFSQRVGKPVYVRFQGEGARRTGRMTQVRPHASRKVRPEALAAVAGGPLAVRPISATEHPTLKRGGQNAFQLVSPRFEATARLEPNARSATATGQLAYVWFRTHHETVGGHLYRRLATWIRNRVKTARGAR